MHGAVGVARVWGKYVEHDLGSRWQFGKPVALVDFTDRLAGAYWQAGVARYPDLDTLYGEWAPDRQRWADERKDWCTAINWQDVGYGSAMLAAGGQILTMTGVNNTFTFSGTDLSGLVAPVQGMKNVSTSLTVAGEQMRRLAEAIGMGAQSALQELSTTDRGDRPEEARQREHSGVSYERSAEKRNGRVGARPSCPTDTCSRAGHVG